MVAASEQESLDNTLLALSIGLSFSSIFAIFQYFDWQGIVQVSRPAGTFLNSLILAEFAAPILVWLILKKHWALAIINSIPIFLCHSRIAIVMVFLGLFVGWRPDKKWIKLTVALFTLLIIAYCFTFFGLVKFNSAEHRIVLWGATLMAVDPIGQGLGWFNAAHPPEQFAHSDVIQAMAEIGLGSIFFISAGIYLLLQKEKDIAIFSAFCAACFNIAVGFPLHLPANGFLIAVLAGHMAANRNSIYLLRSKCRNGNCKSLSWQASAGRIS